MSRTQKRKGQSLLSPGYKESHQSPRTAQPVPIEDMQISDRIKEAETDFFSPKYRIPQSDFSPRESIPMNPGPKTMLSTSTAFSTSEDFPRLSLQKQFSFADNPSNTPLSYYAQSASSVSLPPSAESAPFRSVQTDQQSKETFASWLMRKELKSSADKTTKTDRIKEWRLERLERDRRNRETMQMWTEQHESKLREKREMEKHMRRLEQAQQAEKERKAQEHDQLNRVSYQQWIQNKRVQAQAKPSFAPFSQRSKPTKSPKPKKSKPLMKKTPNTPHRLVLSPAESTSIPRSENRPKLTIETTSSLSIQPPHNWSIDLEDISSFV